ncbi:MAG: chemotaxis protein CheX [Halanaerobiales bacterium]
MNLTTNIVNACNNTFPMFGFNTEMISEVTEENLNSAEEINILIGLSNGAQGNIIISFNKNTALGIISKMMGGMEVNEIDNMGKSALGEMANMVMGTTISSISADSIIELSPPSIATGKDMYIMISNVPSQKLEFILDGKKMYISYAVQ